MSCFLVNEAHIRALVNGGLAVGRTSSGPVTWHWEPVHDPAEHAAAFVPGQPYGPSAVELVYRARRVLTPETAQLVGQMLWAENHRSVQYRYQDGEECPTYHHRDEPALPPVAVLKAIDCMEYQSCDAPEWSASQARAFYLCLRRAVVKQLPGYEDAAWEVGCDIAPTPPAPPSAPAPPVNHAKSLGAKEETVAVRRALQAAGLKVLRVGHGRGTARGWLEVRVLGPRVPRVDAAGRFGSEWDRQSPEYAEHERIRRVAARAVMEATGRDPSKDDIQTDYFESCFNVTVAEPGA